MTDPRFYRPDSRPDPRPLPRSVRVLDAVCTVVFNLILLALVGIVAAQIAQRVTR